MLYVRSLRVAKNVFSQAGKTPRPSGPKTKTSAIRNPSLQIRFLSFLLPTLAPTAGHLVHCGAFDPKLASLLSFSCHKQNYNWAKPSHVSQINSDHFEHQSANVCGDRARRSRGMQGKLRFCEGGSSRQVVLYRILMERS